MKDKVVIIKDAAFAQKIQKIFDDKTHITQKIREGKFHEIKSDIKFVLPL